MKIDIPIGPESITIKTYDTGFGLTGDVVSTIERNDAADGIEALEYNAAVDAVESLLLALACEGLLTEGDALNKAVQTAMQTIAESYT